MKYELMTFDALEMFQYAYEKNRLKAPTDTLTFDLDSPLVKSRVLLSTKEQSDNALFYQIRACLEQKSINPAAETESSQIPSENAQAMRECLKYRIIFVDFSKVYSQSDRMNPGYFLNMLEQGKKKEEKEAARKEVIRVLFTKGMKLTFPQTDGSGNIQKVTRKFVPFDKSSSMGRTSRISFVDKDLLVSSEGYTGLDERLRIGIDFSSMEVVNSKYLAYRGLYMSDGVRMDDAELLLNEETVIVLPDGSFTDYTNETKINQRVPAIHDLEPFDFITAVPIKGEGEKPVFDVEIKKVMIQPGTLRDAPDDKKDNPAKDLCERARRVTAFDGEGLVSPEYSALLNKCLKSRSASHRLGHATSFQIRMPFTKGMLHEVNFQAFMKEQIIFPPFGHREGDMIYDAFGIRRDLAKVRIVLSESMFKAVKWLQKKDGNNHYLVGDDPMKFYFDKFHAYSHALYVSQTDLSYSRDTARLSYQFLNTMYLSDAELKGLVDGHVQKARNIACLKMDECRARKCRKEQYAWEYAIGSNKEFLHDPNIENRLKAEKNAMLRNIALGRIEVEGRQRYLAVDLLAFLLHMASCLYCKDSAERKRIADRIDKLAHDKLLYAHKFYLPGMDYGDSELVPDESYAFLRNPHLSRNEECVLCSFMPLKKGEKNNLYTRYFSHLQGIVMVSYYSTVPLILGGADCDGDLVQVVMDPSVNKAILAGAYQKKTIEEDKKITIVYKRKLPVAVILSEQAKSYQLAAFGTEAYYSNMFDTIHDAFTNHIGIISNAAMQMGMEAYDRPVQLKDGSQCEEDLAQPRSEAKADALVQEKLAGGPVFDDNITGQDRCAACTVLTGLDIDASKNGRRPDLEKWLENNMKNHVENSGKKRTKKQTEQADEEDTEALSDAAYFLSVKETMDNLGESYIVSSLRRKTEVKEAKKERKPAESVNTEDYGKGGCGMNEPAEKDSVPITKISVGYIRTDGRNKTFETLTKLGDAELAARRTGIAVLPKLMADSLTDYRDEDVLIVNDASTSGDSGNKEEITQVTPPVTFRFMLGESGEPSDEWKTNLESGIYKSKLAGLKKVLATYESFQKFKQGVRNAKKDLENAHFIENIRFILKVEYDQEWDLPGIEGQNFASAVEISYAMLQEYSRSKEETGKMLERLVENRWAFLSGNDSRAKALYRIFGVSEDAIEREAFDNLIGMEAAKRLFLDRSETGFWILFYMLKELETEQEKQAVSLDRVNAILEGRAPGDVVLFKKLVGQYFECEAQKKPFTKVTNRLLMKRIREIFDQDLSVALRALVYLCDANNALSGATPSKRAGDFLWEVFAEDKEEIPGVSEEVSCGYQAFIYGLQQEEDEKAIEETNISESDQDICVYTSDEKEADHVR